SRESPTNLGGWRPATSRGYLDRTRTQRRSDRDVIFAPGRGLLGARPRPRLWLMQALWRNRRPRDAARSRFKHGIKAESSNHLHASFTATDEGSVSVRRRRCGRVNAIGPAAPIHGPALLGT